MNVTRAFCIDCGIAYPFFGGNPEHRARVACCDDCRKPLHIPSFPPCAPALERCALSPAEYIVSQRLLDTAL